MSNIFERVYTVTDYCDGPLEGAADFDHKPHIYRAIFSPARDENDPNLDVFELGPMPSDVLTLALEAAQIENEFQLALIAKAIDVSLVGEDWGALPKDQAQYLALKAQLAPFLVIQPDNRRFARGQFRARQPIAPNHVQGILAPLEVLWTPLDAPAA